MESRKASSDKRQRKALEEAGLQHLVARYDYFGSKYQRHLHVAIEYIIHFQHYVSCLPARKTGRKRNVVMYLLSYLLALRLPNCLSTYYKNQSYQTLLATFSVTVA